MEQDFMNWGKEEWLDVAKTAALVFMLLWIFG
jgi:hypothetical protein